MSKINNATNNKFFSCPAQMSDGRIFTNYGPNCKLNNSIIKKNNLKDTYEYRQYLINNGEALIEANRTTNAAQNGCKSCVNLNKDTLPGMPSCDDPKNKYENLN